MLAWRQLLWTALLFCLVCTVCSQQSAMDMQNPNFKSIVKELPKTHKPTAPPAQGPMTPPSSVASSTMPLEGATVTGALYKNSLVVSGNRYDPAVALIPAIAGNVKGNVDVAVKDTWTEFGADWALGDVESLDITTTGLITLRVDFKWFQFTEAEYVFESPAFRKFTSVSLVSSSLPADVSVTVSGADDLAAGTFRINIASFEDLDGAPVVFLLQYKLVPRECEPGPGALCCSRDGKLLKGNVCRKGTWVCELEQKCDGVDPTCPFNRPVDGTECPYHPPHSWFDSSSMEAQATIAVAGGLHTQQGDGYQYGVPPLCVGQCSAGKCRLDKTQSGCCTLLKSKQDYAEVSSVISNDRTAPPAQQAGLEKTKDGVYCWKGTDYGY